MTTLPRLLFVTSAAFNPITGGGITFSNLFRNWPADRLATVHNDPVPVTTDICRHYYRLGAGEIARWPARWRNDTVPGDAIAPTTPRPAPLRLAKTLLIGNAWPDEGRLSPALESWIETFRPELLYTILGTIGMMELVEAIRRRFALPLVVHFMDDWPAALYRGGLLSALPRARMERRLRGLIDAATTRLAIGESMAAAFAQRYGAPFVPFQNALDMTALLKLAMSRPARDPARILYVGSIFENAQLQSLIDAAHAVASLAAAGRRVKLEIRSPGFLAERFRSRLEISPAVRLGDAIADDDAFFAAIREADLLLLPVNFDEDSVRFIRHSMPTKLPAYLASGTPVLVYGPRAVEQVAYAAREGWGEIVSDRDIDRLAQRIVGLLDDDRLRRARVERAIEVARRNHDAATVQRCFQETLAMAASVSVKVAA
jgi:glycosyltransferase involved in cell wall biosynthesis